MATDTVKYADLIGKPYKLGGRGPQSYDCYGLIEVLMARQGLTAPDYSRPETLGALGSAMNDSKPFWTETECEAGSVAAIRIGNRTLISHVAMILPHEKMIHVWEKSGGVCVERITDQWRRRIAGYYKFDK